METVTFDWFDQRPGIATDERDIGFVDERDLDRAYELIALEREGRDCSDDGSAWIKRYFDVNPAGYGATDELCVAYPLEYAEWCDDVERGIRPF